jgi:hypothetical protein
VVALLARSFGATRAGAALGALVLATSASFWFNADFAKHYAFSGLARDDATRQAIFWRDGRKTRIVARQELETGSRIRGRFQLFSPPDAPARPVVTLLREGRPGPEGGAISDVRPPAGSAQAAVASLVRVEGGPAEQLVVYVDLAAPPSP